MVDYILKKKKIFFIVLTGNKVPVRQSTPPRRGAVDRHRAPLAVAAPPAKDPRREDHDEQQNDEAHHKVD